MVSDTHSRHAVIRCDGGAGIGLGHVMRCLALAEALADCNWSCTFAGTEETEALPQITEAGVRFHVLDHPADPECLMRMPSPDILVVDHYGLGEAYERACNAWAGMVLVLDDQPNRPHSADLLLDAGHGRSPQDYAGLVSEECRFLLGLEYALLRSDFSRLRQASLDKPVPSRVNRVCVSFGGVDSKGVCLEALRALGSVNYKVNVDVIIGASSPHLDALHSAAGMSSHFVQVHVDSKDIPALLVASDLALGAAGVSAWERCALGIPSIVVCAAGNQQMTYDALVDTGAARGVRGPGAGLADAMAQALLELIEEPVRRGDMKIKSTSLCDGKGASRAAAMIKGFISKSGIHAEDRIHRSCAS